MGQLVKSLRFSILLLLQPKDNLTAGTSANFSATRNLKLRHTRILQRLHTFGAG